LRRPIGYFELRPASLASVESDHTGLTST